MSAWIWIVFLKDDFSTCEITKLFMFHLAPFRTTAMSTDYARENIFTLSAIMFSLTR